MNIVFDCIYGNIYTKIFPDYLVELKRAVGGCKDILDLGCGKSSLLKFFPADIRKEGVELYGPYLEESRSLGIHNRYHQMDILEAGDHFAEDSFECVYAGDVIEHLEKDDGHKLIEAMEKIASKRVIIYTPNGFLPVGERDGNELYRHRSGWSVSEMRALGFDIIGTSGWKVLRGDDAGVRWRPKIFWRVVSDMTQWFTRRRPESAKQILCVKRMDG